MTDEESFKDGDYVWCKLTYPEPPWVARITESRCDRNKTYLVQPAYASWEEGFPVCIPVWRSEMKRATKEEYEQAVLEYELQK